MESLDRITLTQDADVRKIDDNFVKVKNAIDTAESNIANKQDKLASGTNIKTINNESLLGSGNINIQGGSGNEPIKTTYADLVALINNSQLVVGQSYRITDYSTFVNSSYDGVVQIADHQFDIIVEAVSTNKLLSDAKAAVHSGVTYFQYEELYSWELKYDINNDTSKYDWADTNGRGVIYYMKDNHNNVCSYDFKNIMFMRYSDPNYNNYYTGVPYKEYDSSVQTFPSGLTGSTKPYYTFSYSDNYLDFDSSRDLSVNWDSDPQIGWNSNHRRCENNIIKPVYFQDGMADSPLTLNNVVIFQFSLYGISGHYYDIVKNSSIVMSPAGWNNKNLVQNSYLQYFCGVISGSYLIDSNVQGLCNIEISSSILVKSNGGNISSPYLNGAVIAVCVYLNKNFSVSSGEYLSFVTVVGATKYQISFSLDGALFSDGVTRIVKFNYITTKTFNPYISGQTINQWLNMSVQNEFTLVNGLITKNTETKYTPITIYVSEYGYMDRIMVVMQYGSDIIDIGQATPVGGTINVTPITN